MSEWMSRLSSSQANFWELQADYYRPLEKVEDRQAKIEEILSPHQKRHRIRAKNYHINC